MPCYLALDIGGTKLMAAAVDGHGRILRRARAPTPLDLHEGLERIVRLGREVSAGAPIAAVGAALGGPLDAQRGVVSPLHQPQWREVPFAAHMSAAFGCETFLDVDTNVAALGEYEASAAPPSRLLYLTLSTGMGGGFIVDGEIYRGRDGGHPEVGHQAVPSRTRHPERVACACGASDCLEALVSGNGIRRLYGRAAEALDADAWAEVAYHLGQGLRNLAAIYLPDEIAIGGGVAVGGGAPFLAAAAEVMRAHLKLLPAPRVRASRLGYDTALLGAAALARRGHALPRR